MVAVVPERTLESIDPGHIPRVVDRERVGGAQTKNPAWSRVFH